MFDRGSPALSWAVAPFATGEAGWRHAGKKQTKDAGGALKKRVASRVSLRTIDSSTDCLFDLQRGQGFGKDLHYPGTKPESPWLGRRVHDGKAWLLNFRRYLESRATALT